MGVTTLAGGRVLATDSAGNIIYGTVLLTSVRVRFTDGVVQTLKPAKLVQMKMTQRAAHLRLVTVTLNHQRLEQRERKMKRLSFLETGG